MGESKSIKYKIILLQLGISQRELANILGFTESYISMIMKGKRDNSQLDKWMRANAPEYFKREYCKNEK